LTKKLVETISSTTTVVRINGKLSMQQKVPFFNIAYEIKNALFSLKHLRKVRKFHLEGKNYAHKMSFS